MGPENHNLTNFDYECTAVLGKPGSANCLAALYQFSGSGPVVLGPASDPVIKTADNCAIGALKDASYRCGLSSGTMLERPSIKFDGVLS